MGYSHRMKDMPKQYDHAAAEKKWQDAWFEGDVYHYKGDQSREDTFVIDTPPPTVSGLLHMGHVFSYTQCDFVARYQRMKGKDVFYPMGFDDNGLPTERLVEKVKKIQAHRYIGENGREAFRALCDEVASEARKDFRTLFQSIALSIDWNQEYHTISEEVRTISQLSFLDLHQKGHIERRLEPMLWDPVDQTAIAQAEIVDKEMPSHFNDIIFGVEGSDETFTIGTTRPELIPACVAIFFHPDDERYQHLKDKFATTPLFNVAVPILTDEAVEMDKGTGIMMCCTFGDEADIEKWRKHDLPARVILNKYGKMDFASADWIGATPLTEELQNKKASNPDKKHPGARQIILQKLEDAGLLVKSEPITHTVKCAERSGAPLEILPTYQWFVKVTDKKEALTARAKECTWYPEWMRLRMEQWIDGLNWDWCISRQRYFGVPFPVWYVVDAQGKLHNTIIAESDDLPANPLQRLPKGFKGAISNQAEFTEDDLMKVEDRPHTNGYFAADRTVIKFESQAEAFDEPRFIVPESDVMDTWATSSVSPQINSRWHLNPARHKALFPADLRPQAHEIIRTWAFYTVVKAHLHEDTIPWKNLMISGWCLAEDKTKMSKSKGNVVTPVELIEERGTDAVRYWAATSKLGTDTAFSTDALKIGKKLVTKLWNATKFAALHLQKLEQQPGTANDDIEAGLISETMDLWILTRLHRTINEASAAFDAFEYADAMRSIESFFWNDFCDNYLELVKKRAYNEDGSAGDGQRSAVHTIYHCLHGILTLFAPIVPHITEELYSHIFPDLWEKQGSLHARGSWLNANNYPFDASAEASGIAAVAVLEAVRKAKSERNVSIKYPLTNVALSSGTGEVGGDWLRIEDTAYDIKGAGNIAHMEWGESPAEMTVETEDGAYQLHITFAAQSDVA
ncbi:MAG: valine--tRNA ligase [Rickettsiales bacterium]|nr:valine--tRNA ligase [Rickettsiales bacterium]